jgi:hypothetical protein
VTVTFCNLETVTFYPLWVKVIFLVYEKMVLEVLSLEMVICVEIELSF